MPKRVEKLCSNNPAKVCGKSGLVGDSVQLSDLPENYGSGEEILTVKTGKHMQYLKLNQKNELERLLLHNSNLLRNHVDHSDFPAFNVSMWPQESTENLSTYPSYAISTPRPLFIANKQSAQIDLCYKRPMNRDFYIKRMKHTRSSYQTALKSNKNIRSSIKDEIYHSSVFDIAERVYMEPDPYFHSSYDFYFTGGNLCILPHQGRLIHAGGEQLQEILASEFPMADKYNDTDYLHQIASLRTSENCEIFEVHPLITSPGNSGQNCFIARQRNVVTFNHLNDHNQIKTVKQFRTKSTPFISFAQSDRDINNFVITTMKQHIRLYDLNCSVPALVKLFKISPNSANISWNTIKPWRENTFLYANEKQFFMIDVRTSPKQWLNQVTFATDSLPCDHISAVLPSNFNNLFYVATNHKLKCMDIRQLKKYSLSNPDAAVCGWSHQLRYAPLMIDTFRLNQTELIALSSPIAGDLHILQLSRERNADNISLESSLHVSKHIYSAPCLPYQPPTLLEAYGNARLSGKCLSPKANFEARLKWCTTGMNFLNLSLKNSKCGIGLLITLNSNGDVVAHTLTKREQKETEDRLNRLSDEIMAEFERKICQKTQLTLNYTEIKNMKGLRKVMLCKSLSSNKKYDFDAMDDEYVEAVPRDSNVINSPKKVRIKRHWGRWQKSLSTLHSYKDALVADLLSIWDIDIEEEQNCHMGHLRHNHKIDPEANVKDWLKQNINFSAPPMVSIPLQETSIYSENDTSHIFDITLTQSKNTTIDFENAVHSTQILDNSNVTQINNETTINVVETLKNKKKNKKYMKGF